MTVSSRGQTGLARLLVAVISMAATGAGLWLTSHHPLWPGAVSAAFCVWLGISFLRPGLWLAVLPATLPLLNFSPWTGWLIFDEFDLMVMGAIAGEFARLARPGLRPIPGSGTAPPSLAQRSATVVVIALTSLGLVSLCRGLGDAGGSSFGLFQGYTDPLNGVRVFKPLLYTMLLLPPLQRTLRDAASTRLAIERLTGGMLIGLSVVVLAVLWERAAHPGLLNFSSPYRTVALFWEMHVGGAAIDAYLALATPFVAWRLYSSTTPLQWGAAAALALLAEYACLTTFSRGVYLSVIGPLVLLSLLLRRQGRHREPWVSGARSRLVWARLLAAAMLIEAVLALGSGTFMMGRVGASGQDLRSRLEHWRHGLDLLRTPGDWVFGTGLGRFPPSYAAAISGGEFPGGVKLGGGPTDPFVRVSGPRTMASLGGLYGLTQHVPMPASESQVVRFDVRTAQATHLRLSVCEMHLLYESHCQVAQTEVATTGTDWRPVVVRLVGRRLTRGDWYAPRMAVFSVSVLDAGTAVDLRKLSLRGDDAAELIRNGEFSQQLAHWFPVATNQFLPWHVDNLYLEVLIERGALGLGAFMLLIACAVWCLLLGPGRRLTVSPFLVASLAGAMTIGLVGSVMDVPRVALLLFLVTLFSIRLNGEMTEV